MTAAIIFWWAMRRGHTTIAEPELVPAIPTRARRNSRWVQGLSWLSSLLAATLFGYALVGMAVGDYHALWGWLLLAAFLLAGVAFAAQDRGAGVGWWRPPLWWELVVLALIIATFIGLNSFDLTNWYYSAIGDEYAFFSEGRRIAEGGDFNPFSQAGVYGYHPVLSSAYQALGMRLFGVDHFGWKLSSVLAVAISFPFFYLLVSRLWGRCTVVIATAVLASSHLLFGYAHTGYNNVQALPISLASFWLFFAGLHRRSRLLLLLAGATAGLGFYTIYTGRIAAVVLAVFALLVYRFRPPRWLLAPTLTGAAFALGPLFAVNGLDVITQMADQSSLGYESTIVGDRLQRMLQNIPINLIAFNYNVQLHHYVTGSLLDPASAVLAVLGVGALLVGFRSRRALFLVVWWVVAIVVTGVFTPHPYVAPSRIQYLVPCYALAAGLSLNHLAISVDSLRLLPRWRWAVLSIAGVGVMALILGLNLYRFWDQSPPRAPIANEAVAVRAVRSPACTRSPGIHIVAGGDTYLLRNVFGSYGSQKVPRLLSTGELMSRPLQEGETASCIVLLPPLEPTQSGLATALQGDGRVWETEIITDHSGSRQAVVFFPQPH